MAVCTAVGDATVAIDWNYAREVLKKADRVIATVGIAAEDPNAPAASTARATPGQDAAQWH